MQKLTREMKSDGRLQMARSRRPMLATPSIRAFNLFVNTLRLYGRRFREAVADLEDVSSARKIFGSGANRMGTVGGVGAHLRALGHPSISAFTSRLKLPYLDYS